MNIELINEMERAGFTREQTMVLGKFIEGDLATKQDIKELDFKIETVRADLKRDIKELDGKIETTKAELKKDMIIIMGGYVFFILTALATLSRFGFFAVPPSTP